MSHPTRLAFATRRPLLLIAVAQVLLLALAVGGGAAAESGSGTSPALAIVVTIEPLSLLMREVGAEDVRIHTLVPPGASPHGFEPRPSDLKVVARADSFIRVGAGFDDWATRLMLQAPELSQVDSLEAMLDSTTAGGESDALHVWLDPIAVRDQIVPALVAHLSGLNPGATTRFEARGAQFRERLTGLDAEIRTTLRQTQGRRYVAFHNAWRHFARRYDLEELAVVQEFAGEEPTPKELALLVQSARRAGVPAILVEPQLDPRIARTIASEFGATTQLVDPLGDPTIPERATYDSLMRFNAAAFARSLGGDMR